MKRAHRAEAVWWDRAAVDAAWMVHACATKQKVARATVGRATGGSSPTCCLMLVSATKASRRERARASSSDADEPLLGAGIVVAMGSESCASTRARANKKEGAGAEGTE